jgi:Holliday junction resolvase RusA-like endonuclease
MYTIFLPLPISINTAYGTDFRSKRRFKTCKYKEWEKLADQYLWTQKKEFFNCKVQVTYEVWQPKDSRVRDLSNLLKVTDDYLVSRNILKDDRYIYDFRMFWSQEEKQEEWHGVKITICPLNIWNAIWKRASELINQYFE